MFLIRIWKRIREEFQFLNRTTAIRTDIKSSYWSFFFLMFFLLIKFETNWESLLIAWWQILTWTQRVYTVILRSYTRQIDRPWWRMKNWAICQIDRLAFDIMTKIMPWNSIVRRILVVYSGVRHLNSWHLKLRIIIFFRMNSMSCSCIRIGQVSLSIEVLFYAAPPNRTILSQPRSNHFAMRVEIATEPTLSIHIFS